MRRLAPAILVALLAGCGELERQAAEPAPAAGGSAAVPAEARAAGGVEEVGVGEAGAGETRVDAAGVDAARVDGAAPAGAAPASRRMTPVPEAAGAPHRPAAARWSTARILRRTWLRRAPGGRRVTRVGRRTRFGGPQVLAVARRRGDWLAVHTPRLPNGRLGWVRAAAVRIGAVALSVHVDRSARRLTVRRGRRVLRRVTVAVGRPGHETPLGRFGVTDRLSMPPGTPYGCCAVALSGHQTSLPAGWAGGDRLAVHGTTDPASVGTAVSLGCLRAGDADIRWLLRHIPLGAPVFIRA
jgi:hypothetical protein